MENKNTSKSSTVEAPLHLPVLYDQVLQATNSGHSSPNAILDLTLGRGGHLKALAEKYPEASLFAVDRDQEAIEYARANFADLIADGRLNLYHSSFADPPNELLSQKFDFILADLGVSSPQLDESRRGFSFYNDGPLDMRMDITQDFTAQDIVNTWEKDELYQLFKEKGEVRRPYKTIDRIIERRNESPITTTNDLSEIIISAEGWRRKGRHPATLYFMALRLEVNQELEQVQKMVPLWLERLNKSGRMAVITFHSLEDRIVKNLFRDSEIGKKVNKKVIVADREEQKYNPRSRSAKLRIFERE